MGIWRNSNDWYGGKKQKYQQVAAKRKDERKTKVMFKNPQSTKEKGIINKSCVLTTKRLLIGLFEKYRLALTRYRYESHLYVPQSHQTISSAIRLFQSKAKYIC